MQAAAFMSQLHTRTHTQDAALQLARGRAARARWAGRGRGGAGGAGGAGGGVARGGVGERGPGDDGGPHVPLRYVPGPGERAVGRCMLYGT
jgi:hypothetical protein